MAFSCGYSEKYVTQMKKYDILHLICFLSKEYKNNNNHKNKGKHCDRDQYATL